MPYLKVTLAVSTARSGTLRTPLGQITDKDIRRQVFYLSTFKERIFFFFPLFEMSWIYNLFFDPIGIMNVFVRLFVV